MKDQEQNSFTDDFYRLDHYLMSYFSAMHILTKRIEFNKHLIYSLTFLLSNYMELWIKNMVLIQDHDFFAYDIKSMELNTHYVLFLLKDKYVVDLMRRKKINMKSYNEIVKLYKYFSKFANNTNLSEAMRYPISVKNNIPTINLKQIDNINYREYNKKITKLMNLTMGLYSDFFKSVMKQEEYYSNVILPKMLKNMIDKEKN